MAKRFADVYLADIPMWNGITPLGNLGADVPPKPKERADADLIVPWIGVNQSWSDTIDKILDGLKPGQLIANLFMMGHGAAGEFTIGRLLQWNDDATIARFKRLRPFMMISVTNAYVVGCESAADGPCVVTSLQFTDRSGATRTVPQVCLGQFSGDMTKPGYQLLRKLADVMNVPVSGSTWKLAIKNGWEINSARLTVGPGGGWAYRAINEHGARFGAP